MVLHDPAGNVIDRRYPILDEDGVKMATDYFEQYRGNYPLGIRRRIAVGIVKKAAEFGVPVEPFISREAGDGIPVKNILMNEILERAHLTKDAEAAVVLGNINELLFVSDETDISENLGKIAEVLDAFDRSAGLEQYYNDKILMPADFLYDISLKQA